MSSNAPQASPTVDSVFQGVCKSKPQRLALVDGDRRLTFKTLDYLVEMFALRLRRAGVEPGDRILLGLPNGAEYVVAFFGGVRVGATVCPADPRWSATEYRRLIDLVRPTAIVSRSAARTSGPYINLATLQPAVAEFDPTPVLMPPPGVEAVFDRLDVNPEWDRVPAEADLSVPAAVFFTSGTDGDPRAVAHSHETVLACVNALHSIRRGYFSLRPDRIIALLRLVAKYKGRLVRPALDRNVWMTPLSFSSISGHVIMTQAFLSGNTLVTVPFFDPTATLKAVEKEKVTYLALTPTMGELCLRTRVETFNLRSLLVVGFGGSHASPALADRVRRRFGCAVALGYGSTELGGGILASSVFDGDVRQVETVGRAFPGTQIRITDENSLPVPPGTVGELTVRSDGMMLGYELSSGRRRPVDDDGWYHTGDLATIDNDGYVRIVGRKSDLIIRGGQNVYPREIEEVLEQHHGVDRTAVVGVPDRVAGERIWAFVTAREGRRVDASELLRFCRGRLSRAKMPDKIRFVEELPLARDGKIRKSELRLLALTETQLAEPEPSESVP